MALPFKMFGRTGCDPNSHGRRLGAVGLETGNRGGLPGEHRNRSLLAKVVGKGTAGSSKGIEYQHKDIRVGGKSRICHSVWMEGPAQGWGGRWGQITEGLEWWAQELGFVPWAIGSHRRVRVRE